jgi:SET domain-containing protein
MQEHSPASVQARFINDARSADDKDGGPANNATMREVGDEEIRIFATRYIEEGREIMMDYGEDYWGSQAAQSEWGTMLSAKTMRESIFVRTLNSLIGKG